MNKPAQRIYEFGAFRLDTSDRLLWHRGERVPLTPKVFDTLLLLLESHGHLVEKDEFMERLWPGTFVGEDTLAQNISVLRKVLGGAGNGQEYIATVPKRGYRFVAALRDVTEASAESEERKEAPPASVVAEREGAGQQRAWAAQPRGQAAARVGGMPRSVVLLALLLGLAALGYLGWRRLRPLPPAGRITLVVLPFQNLSGDPGEDYVSDGFTEEMITQLGRLHPDRLGVIARTSAMVYKGTQKDTTEISRELRVDYLLEGSLRRVGEHVRISAQLIQAKDQMHVWAENYDRDVGDLLAVQGEVAQAIADRIQLKLTPREVRRVRRPVNAQALEAYLKGRYFWNKRTLDGFKEAEEYFRQAIEKDPAYAEAYAGLADAYVLIGGYGWVPQQETIPKARVAANKALELDTTLAEAHASLGLIADNYDLDWAAAEREFKRAIELNPNYASAHHWYGEHQVLMGRGEGGLAETKRALELDPLSLIIHTDEGKAFYLMRQYDRAIAQLHRTLAMDPNMLMAHVWLAEAYLHKRMYPEALAEITRVKQLSGGVGPLSTLSRTYAAMGNRAEAERMLEELKQRAKRQYVAPLEFSQVYASLGDKDQAFAWLEKTYEQRGMGLIGLKVDANWDALRSDARFADLMRRLGLPP